MSFLIAFLQSLTVDGAASIRNWSDVFVFNLKQQFALEFEEKLFTHLLSEISP